MLLLAGCATSGAPTDALEAARRQAAAGDWRTLAAGPVACANAEAGCGQRHRLRGEACMHLADTAPAGTAAAQYDCALAEYAAALRALLAHPDPALDSLRLRIAELAALERRRDRSGSHAEAVAYNDRLLVTATALVDTAPGAAAGYTYLAGGLLARGLDQAPPERCAELDRAAASLALAAGRAGADPATLARRRHDIAAARARQCPA